MGLVEYTGPSFLLKFLLHQLKVIPIKRLLSNLFVYCFVIKVADRIMKPLNFLIVIFYTKYVDEYKVYSCNLKRSTFMTNKKLVLQLLVVSAFIGTQVNADWMEDARRALDPNRNGFAASAAQTTAAATSAFATVGDALTTAGNAISSGITTVGDALKENVTTDNFNKGFATAGAAIKEYVTIDNINKGVNIAGAAIKENVTADNINKGVNIAGAAIKKNVTADNIIKGINIAIAATDSALTPVTQNFIDYGNSVAQYLNATITALDPNQNGAAEAFKPVAEAFIQYGNSVAGSFRPYEDHSFAVMVGNVPLAAIKNLHLIAATAPIIKNGPCKLVLNNLTGKSFTLHQHSYATGSLNTDVLPVKDSTLDLTIGEQYFLLLSDGSKIFIKPTASNSIDSYVLSSKVYNTGTMTQSYNFSNLYLLPRANSVYALLAN